MAKRTYEQMIEDIEKLMEELDNKELPLEEAVKKYKTGMELIGECSKTLDKVEKELKIVEVDDDE